MPLAMVVLMVCLASFASADAAADLCNTNLRLLMTGMHQLENGLLFYHENINLKSTEAALKGIEEFYKNVNNVELTCQVNGNDITTSEESCTDDVFCTTN